MLKSTISFGDLSQRPIFIFIGVLIVLGSFLFINNNVLAADDNLYPDINDCAPLPIGENCDSNQTACVSTFNFNWTSSGYPSGAGHASCCGDDSSEYLANTDILSDVEWLWAQKSCTGNPCYTGQACCSNSQDCTYNGGCYTRYQGHNLQSSGNDKWVACELGQGGVEEWDDCDLSYADCGSSICGSASGVRAGELSTGEYSNTTSLECCGDDSSEYSKTCSAGAGATCNTTANLCCNASTDCVYNVSGDNCYSAGNTLDTADAQSEEEVCDGSIWKDRDSSSAICYNGVSECTSQQGATKCYKWQITGCSAGASACDDYDGNLTNGYCCGDSTDEWFNTAAKDSSITWADATTACCNQNSCVRNSACYVNTASGLNTGGNDNKAECVPISNKYTWKDCDGDLLSCAIIGDNFCGNTPADPGLMSGEASVGEYPNQTTKQCCGDDNNEFEITNFCSGYSGSAKCCNNINDWIDSTGVCVPTCPPAAQPDLIVEDITWAPSPINEGSTVTFTVRFRNQGTGNAAASHATYYIDSSDVAYENVPAINAGSYSDQTFTWAAAGGSHTVRAVADDLSAVAESNETNNERTENFSVNRPPGAFDLTAPANNAGCQPTNPTLQWGASSDPDGGVVTYNLYYCQGASCSLPGTPNISGISATTWSLSGLTAGAAYRWNIIASDGSLQTSSSNGPFAFTVNNPPNTPTNPTPANSATCIAFQPTLSWSGGDPDVCDTTITYKIYWCTGSGCSPTTLQATVTNTTSYAPSSSFSPNTIVRWKVEASDTKVSATSPVWQFTTSAGLPTASVTDGVNATCSASDTVAVSWSNGATGAWGYSADNVCNSGDSFPNSGNSALVNSTHSDYLCFRALNSCSLYAYSPAQGQLKVDVSAPSITSVSASCQSSFVRVTVNGAADTGCAGLASSAYSFDGGGTWQTSNSKDFSGYSLDLAAGQIKVRDALGNTFTYGNPVNINCGAPPPTNNAPNTPNNLSQSPGSEGALTTDNTPSFNFTISDPDAGDTVGYFIQIASDANFNSIIRSYDWAGSTTNPNGVSYLVSPALPDNSYYWRVRAKDLAGLYSGWAEDSSGFGSTGLDFTVDTTPPPAPTCDPGSTSFSTSINVSCSDSEAGVTIRYTTNGSDPTAGSSVYVSTLNFTDSTTLKVRAWDPAANASTVNSYTYTKGNYPDTSITGNPSNPSNDTTPTFSFTGTNSPTGFQCRYDGAGSWVSCTSAHTYTAAQGNRTFEVRAINTYGTDASPASYLWLIDLTNPTITNLTATTPICSGSSTNVSWTGADSGGAGINRQELWRNVNSGGWMGWCSDGSWRADCAAYGGFQNVTSPKSVILTTAGTTEFGIHIFDNAGNYFYSSSVTVTVNPAPGASGAPTYGAPGQTSVPVSWTPGSGATSYNLYRCAGVGCTRPATATHTAVTSTYTDSGLACNNTYNYWIEAVNSCGGTFSLAGGNVTTNTCEEVQIGFNPTSRGWNFSNASVLVTATASSGGVSFVHYCWTTGAVCDPGTANSNDAPFTCSGASPCSAVVSQTSQGAWNLCARARSTAGTWNSSPVCSGIYQIDKTAPNITAFSPSASFVCAGSSITLSWNSNDSGGSAVNRVEVYARPSGGSWGRIISGDCAGDKSASGSCSISPSVTTDYGIHVVDNALNCIDETGDHCDGVASDSLDPRASFGPDTITINPLPATPGTPTYGPPGQNSVTVSWTSGSGATSYNLYRCAGAGCSRPGIATHTGVTSPYTDNTLNCGTTYFYWVEAVNSCGSAFSPGGTNITTSSCGAPTVSFNPTSRAWSQSNAAVAVTITDPNGVRYAHYCWTTGASCDPGTANSNDSPFTCSGASPCSATVTQTTTGSWTLCVRSRDGGSTWNAVPICSGAYEVDKIRPTVNSFTVEDTAPGGSVTITTSGQKPTAKWDVTENESGFNVIELWRANYNSSNCNGATMSGCNWSVASPLWVDNQEDNASGRDDNTAADIADYWYGAHVKDNVDNCALENNMACGSIGNPVRVIMNIGSVPGCSDAPGQPTGLVHTGNTANSITWQWSAPASGDPPSEYRVYNGAGQLVGTTSGTTYTQTKVSQSGAVLSANAEYSVYVVAANSCGTGPASASASAYTSANTPASCSGATVSSSQINWSWISGGAQNSFYASNIAGNSNWIPGLAWSQSSGLVCNTSYTTSVKARNNDGDETAAIQCSASTSACTSSPITADYQWCAASSNTVIFVDQSSGGVGGVTGWEWNFGDGQTCPAVCNVAGYNGSNQYPVHQYSSSFLPFTSAQFTWHSTFNSASAVTSPATGPAGSVVGDVNFIAAKYANGAEITDPSWSPDYISVPRNGVLSLNRGAIVFWYRPNYNHTAATNNDFIEAGSLNGAGSDDDDTFQFMHNSSGELYFKIEDGLGTTNYTRVTSSNYSWSAGDWVKLEIRWRNGAGGYMSIRLNGSEVARRNNNNIGQGVTLANNITVGSNGNGLKMNGTMDEFMIFNTDSYTLSGGTSLTDYTAILTARDSASNSDQSIQTVHLDPVTYSCAGLGCEPACYTPSPCSTSQCDNNTNGFRYRQTRAAVCPDNCHCPAWSAYQSCQSSYNNCPDALPYHRVECYTGTGCDTAVNACACAVGYEPNGSGGCDLREFAFYEAKSLGSTQLSLKWQKQGAATLYTITRNSATFDVTCTTDPCFYTDTGLIAGTTYTYYIYAHVGAGGIYNSTSPTNPVCVGSPINICPLAGTTDSVVGDFTIAPTCGQLALSWDNINVGGLTGYVYNVYKTTVGPGELGTLLKQVAAPECPNGAAVCTLADKEILPQVRYYYTIITEKGGVPSSGDAKANSQSYCYQAPGWEER